MHCSRKCLYTRYPSPPTEDIFWPTSPLPIFCINSLAFDTLLPLGISQNPSWSRYGYFLSPHNLFFASMTGLKVVKVRAEAMQEASDQVPSGLVSIMGHAGLDVESLCRDAEEWSYSRGTQEPVACVANYLFPGGWVLGGDKSSVQYILEYGKDKVCLRSLWPFKVSTPCPFPPIFLQSLHWSVPTPCL